MFYLPQSHNPDKHELMPGEYPWQISHTPVEGFIEISESDLNNLLSIDISAYQDAVAYAKNLEQQTEQRVFGQYLIPEMVDLMGAKNLTLAQKGVPINMNQLAADNSSIKLLIETGALKTARSLCYLLKAKYPYHASVYDHVIEDITGFLTEKGYE